MVKPPLLKGLYALFFLFILCSIAYAVPPVDTIVVSDANLVMAYPHPAYIKQNEDLFIRFWVFNATTGSYFTNVSINCTYYLVNGDGKIVYRLSTQNLSSPYVIKFAGLETNLCQNCFNGNVSKTMFSETGTYEFHLKCVGDKIGGSLIGGYEVTDDGISNPTPILFTDKINTLMYFGFIVMMVLFIAGYKLADKTFIILATFICIAEGTYFFINGFFGFDNLISQTVSSILICVGGYILIKITALEE